MAEREASEELPEDVAAYFKYKKDTGRGIEDYVKLQQDFTSMEDDKLLAEYYLTTEDGIDREIDWTGDAPNMLRFSKKLLDLLEDGEGEELA